MIKITDQCRTIFSYQPSQTHITLPKKKKRQSDEKCK